MQNLSIDENNRNTLGGVIQGTNLTLPCFINPSTGELLVEIHTVTSDGTAISPRNLAIDENTRNTLGGITDDSNKNIIPLTANMHLDLPCLRIDANLV